MNTFKSLITINLLLFTVIISAQTTFSRTIAVKLYQNVEVNSNYFLKNGLEAFYLTPALVLSTKKGNKMEFEISHMNFRDYNIFNPVTNEFESSKKEAAFFLRWEYIFVFNNDNKWKPTVGISVTPFFQSLTNHSKEGFNTSKKDVGAYLTAIPRLEYKLNDRWFLDLNIPLSYGSIKYTFETDNNPLLTLEEQNTTQFIADKWTSLGIRFGVGVVL